MQDRRKGIQKLTDNDLMPFGKHKGKAMANVPDPYLKWLYSQVMKNIEQGKKVSTEYQQVLMYVEDYGLENLNDS